MLFEAESHHLYSSGIRTHLHNVVAQGFNGRGVKIICSSSTNNSIYLLSTDPVVRITASSQISTRQNGTILLFVFNFSGLVYFF